MKTFGLSDDLIYPRGQVAVLQPGSKQQTAEGRDVAKAVPLVDPDDHGPRLAVAGDDRRLSPGRPFDQGGQPGLGLAQLDLSHRRSPFVTNVVTK